MTNVRRFPNYKVSDIPASLEQMAQDIRDGIRDADTCVVCLYKEEAHDDGAISIDAGYGVYGKNISKTLVLGIFQCISHILLGGKL